MRIRIYHETTYRYDQPAKYVIQSLRQEPRGHDGQMVREWRLDLDRDVHFREAKDGLGNLVHTFSLDGPIDQFTVTVIGVVDTFDTNGVVAGSAEAGPPALFLRSTPLSAPDAAIREFAAEAVANAGSPLDRVHALNAALYDAMEFQTDSSTVETSAAVAFEAKSGVCQDYAHIFIAAMRSLGAPARYVSGYFRRTDGVDDQEASHAWAEVYVDDLGWVGFDPTHGLCVTEQHVRVAIGIDYQSAAPTRGAHYGSGGETLNVQLSVTDGPFQNQQQ
ncbi:MAG: transglutaminase family protein [Pseudomonadota bacterium]